MGGITGRTYMERGKPVVIVTQWSGKGPRNVAIRREDGSVVVRPFRGLRKLQLPQEVIRAARDVPRLLAAIEKVLAKADEWDAEAAGSLLEEISEVQRECAAALRETITTALTGEETADAG